MGALALSIGHILVQVPAPEMASNWGTVPVAAWVTAGTFILGSVLTWILRYLDRKRTNRDDRIEAVVELLDGCRRLIELQHGPHKNWAERSAAESSAQKALLKLRSRTQPGQEAALLWIGMVLEAIQFDDNWQDSDAFQATVSDPLFAWIDRPDLSVWFDERTSLSPFVPEPLGQLPDTPQNLLQKAERFARRNL